MRGSALVGSRSATDFSAVTCASSSTAARVVGAALGAAVAAGRGGAGAGGGRGLLRADDPAGDQAEDDAGDSEGDRIRFHENGGLPDHSVSDASPRRARPDTRGRRWIEADEQRARDDGVADRDLVEERQLPEQHQIVEIEVVSGVDAEAERVRQTRGLGVAARTTGRPASAPRSKARANGSVYSSTRSAPIDAAQRIGSGSRIDEQADADAARLQSLDRSLRARSVAVRAASPPGW